jgi:hypothetical protein
MLPARSCITLNLEHRSIFAMRVSPTHVSLVIGQARHVINKDAILRPTDQVVRTAVLRVVCRITAVDIVV